MSKRCNRDCFNCVYDDCIMDTATKEERAEITERDKRYYNASDAWYIIKAKPSRSRYKGRKL